MEEKKFTLGMLSEMLGKFLQIEGKDTIVKGYIKNINKNDRGLYDVKLAYGSHSFTEEQMATLYQDRKVNGNIFLFNNEQDCINNIAAMREVISTGTGATDIDVWKERWWDVHMELLKDGIRHKDLVNATNNIIQDAMQGINEFFKDK